MQVKVEEDKRVGERGTRRRTEGRRVTSKKKSDAEDKQVEEKGERERERQSAGQMVTVEVRSNR
jgi:hypothetical protein